MLGSIQWEEINPHSGGDISVTFAPGAHVSLFDMVKVQIELKTLFTRDVDLVKIASCIILSTIVKYFEQSRERVYAPRLARSRQFSGYVHGGG